MMLDRLTERGEQIARMRQVQSADAIAESFRETLPGATVELDESQVTIVGRGLLKQWLESADLRFLSIARR